MDTAAIPTPPVAAWTRSLRPARAAARSVSAYQAVANTIGTDAARANDQPAGIGASRRASRGDPAPAGLAAGRRASVTATGPNPPSVKPVTRLPGFRPVTPGPVSR